MLLNPNLLIYMKSETVHRLIFVNTTTTFAVTARELSTD